MKTQRVLRRGLILLAAIAAIALAVLGSLNIGGWRALLLARLLRVDNDPVVVEPPSSFQPHVPPGFKVSVYARDLAGPRWLAVAPDGDVFVAESGAGEVVVLHDSQRRGIADSPDIFVDHLNMPFGIAFQNDYVYVANTNEVVRFRYDPKTSKRMGDAQHILDLPGMGYHQHWTRSLSFSPDGKKLFVSVGSKTNVSIEADSRRAAILVANPDGTNMRVYASGLRNAVGIAFNPDSNELWAAVNERDDISDNLPPDYFTHVADGGFYGWPYAYIGQHPDNRVSQKPDLVAKTLVPDVLLGPHVAPLQVAFYDKQAFPFYYWHGAFIAEHGSWNRRLRNGYLVVFIRFLHGKPAGEPLPFLSGFVPDPAGKNVYGRMAGVAVAADGSLLISDDSRGIIWRVSY